MTTATASASPTNKKHVIRSKHANYRFRDVQFVNGTAIVDDRTLASMQSDQHFGLGKLFWLVRSDGQTEVQAAEPTKLKLTNAGDADDDQDKKDDVIEVPSAEVLKQLLEGAVENEVVTRGGGGHYMFQDASLGQNEGAVIAKLESNPELYQQLSEANQKARAGEQTED